MTSYALTNSAIGLLVLVGLSMLQSAPPRPKLWMCIGATAAWYVPWQSLASYWTPGSLFVRYARLDILQTLPNPETAIAPHSGAVLMPWSNILIGAFTIGSLLFVVRVAIHICRQQTLSKSARLVPDAWIRAGLADSRTPVLVARNLDNAFVSGYFRPCIWIGESQLTSPALPSILQHELTHVRHRDNLILLFVTLTADLFWWNPLVRYLAHKVRHYVELSCDLACQKCSPVYRVQLSNELLNRQYRMHGSRFVSPMAWSRGFNAYRIRELARENVMKIRHVCLLGLLLTTGFVLVSNVAISQVATSNQQIVNQLTITTNDGEDTRTMVTEFIGEPEVQKMLRLANAADVTVDVYKAGELRREIVITSNDKDEVTKVLTAFDGSPLENIYAQSSSSANGRTGTAVQPMLLEVSFKGGGEARSAVTLAPDVGQWTGATFADYLVRVKPELLGGANPETVLLSAEISRRGEHAYELLATPRLTAKMGHEAAIELGAGDDTILSLTVLPRSLPLSMR